MFCFHLYEINCVLIFNNLAITFEDLIVLFIVKKYYKIVYHQFKKKIVTTLLENMFDILNEPAQIKMIT